MAGMFIRKTRIVNPKTKEVYYNFQLIESVRNERGPRQRILLNLGARLDLDDEERKLLANRTEELLKGVQSLIIYPEKIERYAQQYASQLVKRLSVEQSKVSHSEVVSPPEFVNIDVNSITKSEPRSVGAEHLMLQMAQQLELPQQLKTVGLSESEIKLALGSVIARAINPSSERATYTWLCSESGVGELLDCDFKQSSLNKLYQISDKLLKNKQSLETHFEKIEQKFHGYKSTIALYDLTNVYMEGQAKANKKASFGVSKEKRNDCKLITMGLVMNEHGFLERTSILPGKATEPQTLQEMIESLSAQNNLFKPTIVLDAGISTEDNLSWLRKNGYSYVVSARQDAPNLDLEGALVSVGDALNQVKVALIKSPPDSDEKWLYCESQAKAATATQMKLSFQTRFEEDLKKMAAGLLKPKGRKKYVKIVERVGRLKEKHKRISGCYEIEVTASADGKSAVSMTWKIIEEKISDKLTGNYFLRTNLVHLEAKELWHIYNTLRRVEDAFRFMKSSLGLRPVYHQKEKRVDGHLWITVMAYHLIQQCLYQLGKKGIHHHWETVRNIVRSRSRVTMSAKMQNEQTLHYRSTTKLEGRQQEIYQALGLSSHILQARKTTV
jgi:transposase